MAFLQVIQEPDPRLTKVSEPVGAINKRIKKMLSDMVSTMHNCGGIGLAAPQIGINLRAFVMCSEQGVLKVINPVIVYRSESMQFMYEGCLSIKDILVKKTRPSIVHMEYTDINGNKNVIELEGLHSSCAQHELDHLDGILINSDPTSDVISKDEYDQLLKKGKIRESI